MQAFFYYLAVLRGYFDPIYALWKAHVIGAITEDKLHTLGVLSGINYRDCVVTHGHAVTNFAYQRMIYGEYEEPASSKEQYQHVFIVFALDIAVGVTMYHYKNIRCNVLRLSWNSGQHSIFEAFVSHNYSYLQSCEYVSKAEKHNDICGYAFYYGIDSGQYTLCESFLQLLWQYKVPFNHISNFLSGHSLCGGATTALKLILESAKPFDEGAALFRSSCWDVDQLKYLKIILEYGKNITYTDAAPFFSNCNAKITSAFNLLFNQKITYYSAGLLLSDSYDSEHFYAGSEHRSASLQSLLEHNVSSEFAAALLCVNYPMDLSGVREFRPDLIEFTSSWGANGVRAIKVLLDYNVPLNAAVPLLRITHFSKVRVDNLEILLKNNSINFEEIALLGQHKLGIRIITGLGWRLAVQIGNHQDDHLIRAKNLLESTWCQEKLEYLSGLRYDEWYDKHLEYRCTPGYVSEKNLNTEL